MASRLSAFFNINSNFGKTPARSVSLPDANSDESWYRTGSLVGSSSVPEGLSSLHKDIDNLVSEENEGDGSNKNLFKIKRTHWKDKSKVNYCTKCCKAFGFASKKFNCKR